TLAVSIEDSPSATIHLFDFATGRRTRSFALLGHGTLSPDGKRLAGSHEAGLQVIDLARGVPIVVDKQHFMPRYLADGTLLALDGEGGVHAVDVAGKTTSLVPVPRPPSDVMFGPASRIVVHTREGIE